VLERRHPANCPDNIRISIFRDPQIEIGRVPAVFAQEESQDWEAAQFGNVFVARGGAETRARGPIF